MPAAEVLTVEIVKFVHALLVSIPQYVLGSLSAIAILGATPVGGFREKLRWIFLCLGAPIEGLVYYCNVKNDAIIMSTYWLEYDHFKSIDFENSGIIENNDNNNDNYAKDNNIRLEEKNNSNNNDDAARDNNRSEDNNKNGDDITITLESINPEISSVILNYKLFGWNTKIMELTPEQKELMKGCVAEASILDRLSYMVSIYYIVVGIFAGISRAIGPCIKEEWPYIPLTLAWTLPAIFKKVVGGIVVVHNPNKKIVGKIIVKDSPMDRRYNIIETGLFSIIAPWLAVILAYFTNPIGYGSFMLLSLVLLSSSRPLWVKIFGDLCADPTTPCLSMSDIVNK
ncbi:3011_t:CDS:2 [Entrophospora sp. SA101]|nr:8728_t:CDS:2 [Entrophospora sp. SA101]CAJ0750160.1 13247_t:CDS:2 [Entrophospora sp. SA101]CAJ0759081.1 3011_t:CDS:2 [Entrophospora sp. SA101]CAJ0830232.1 21165_t:CDS:2 [Entrophospora sp. SA101]CAJ0830241.1 21169_t:CDS:2 [Entrophospora sp. SA101]